MASTSSGYLDWYANSRGTAVSAVLDEAVNTLDEVGVLNYAHAADMAAMQERAEEAPGNRLEAVLGDIREAIR